MTRASANLRDLPFVILLGEPGIGKSTVLEAEAARENLTAVMASGAIAQPTLN